MFVGLDGLYQFLDLFSNIVPTSPQHLSQKISFQIHNIIRNTYSQIHNTVRNNASVVIWHSRLGHLNIDVTKLICQQCKFLNINKNSLDFCSSCCLGKSHRLPSSYSTTIYSTPFELIFSDLWGLALSTSSCGYLYYVTFVDDYSRCTWLFLMKQRFELLDIFKKIYVEICNQFGVSMKTLRSDNAPKVQNL